MDPATGYRWSLSLRRAWIEIDHELTDEQRDKRRSPYGERGLKSDMIADPSAFEGRSPYGERGLK